MKLSRRKVLTVLGGAAVLGGGYTISTGFPEAVNNIIIQNFGADIAATEDAKDFAEDFIAALKFRSTTTALILSGVHRVQKMNIPVGPHIYAQFERLLVASFVMSTNVAQVYPAAGELYYSGLFDPYANTCANQLSAAFFA